MLKNRIVAAAILVMSLSGLSPVSASPAARIVGGVVTNVASTIFKRLWSLKSPTKAVIPSRSMMKFESGYTVDTVFDGSKLGIEPHSVEVSADGDILILDSDNSNIYRVSSPLSRHSRPKLLVGSGEGYSGHVDGRLREARMNHPKGLAVDDGGNIYIADTMNMAVRKITDSGVVTIAGGRIGRGGSHVDGPSEDAKFSSDFDLVYVAGSCSLLVLDRGNRAIREIQLHKEDCSYSQEDNNNLLLGVAVLAGACFFGYMLALLQRRISAILSYDDNESKVYARNMPPAPYKRPPPSSKSVRPPLIPPEDEEYESQQEGLFASLGRLLVYTSSSFFEIFGGLFPGFRHRKAPNHGPNHNHHHQQQHDSFRQRKSGWPVQESFVIPSENDSSPPPPLETRDPTPKKGYPKDLDKARHYYKQSRGYYNSGDYLLQQQQQQHLQQQQQRYHQHHRRHYPSSAETCYEPQKGVDGEEIVFGAVQEEEDGQRREAVVVKAVDYDGGDQNIRARYNYMSYSSYGY